MLAKMSVEQSLMKASSYAKKGEVAEAQKLYQAVLQAFSKNKRAQQGLAALNKPKQNNAYKVHLRKQSINWSIFITKDNFQL